MYIYIFIYPPFYIYIAQKPSSRRAPFGSQDLEGLRRAAAETLLIAAKDGRLEQVSTVSWGAEVGQGPMAGNK